MSNDSSEIISNMLILLLKKYLVLLLILLLTVLLNISENVYVSQYFLMKKSSKEHYLKFTYFITLYTSLLSLLINLTNPCWIKLFTSWRVHIYIYTPKPQHTMTLVKLLLVLSIQLLLTQRPVDNPVPSQTSEAPQGTHLTGRVMG